MPEPRQAHEITITPFGGRVRVRFDGKPVADTAHALRLEETGLPPVFYIPRGDAHIEYLEESSHRSHCPFKGDASYFDLVTDERRAANAVWSYTDPFPAAREIAGHLAFYPDKVTIETVPVG